MSKTRSSLRACALVLTGVCLLAIAVLAQDSAALLAQADRDYADGRLDAARLMYERAMAAGAQLESDALRSRNLGRCYVAGPHPDLQKGARWLQTALQLAPQAEDARHLIAQVQMQLGAYADAEQNFRTLASAHPANPDYTLGVAAALRRGANVQAAADYLRGVLDAGVTARTVRLEYARLLAFQRQLPEARRQYETLLAADPGNLIAQVGLAKVTSWEGNQEQALRQYERILQHTPSLYDALVGKAFSLLWMGRKAEAVGLLRQANRRHPEDAEVRDAILSLGIAPEERKSEPPRASMRAAVQPQLPPTTPPVQPPKMTALPHPVPPPAWPPQKTVPANRSGSPWVKLTIAAGLVLAVLFVRALLPAPARRQPVTLAINAAPPPKAPSPPPSPVVRAAVAVKAPCPADAGAAQTRCSSLAASVPKDPLAGARVLIVGRDPALVEVERRSLANTAAVVSTFSSWNEVLRLVDSATPQLLLLNPLVDETWTGMTAYIWLTVHRPELQSCTVVVLSTADDVSDQVCRTTHAHVLYQPFSPAELVAAARAVVQDQHSSSPDDTLEIAVARSAGLGT